MCDPISIAGAALSGAGMAANSIAANQVASATNAAEQQTAMLNQVDANRAFAQNKAALGQYDNFAAGQGAMGQQLGDYLKTAVNRAPPPSQMAPTGGSTSAAVAAGAPAVSAFANQQGGALGNVDSFGDYLAQANRGANRHLQQATMNDDFERQNNAVLGLQLNDASHAGDTASLFGSALGGAGSLGIKAGLSGYGSGLTSSIGGLFGGDVSSADAAKAGLAAGLTRTYDPKTGWSIG